MAAATEQQVTAAPMNIKAICKYTDFTPNEKSIATRNGQHLKQTLDRVRNRVVLHARSRAASAYVFSLIAAPVVGQQSDGAPHAIRLGERKHPSERAALKKSGASSPQR
jgi:hypothetical protein